MGAAACYYLSKMGARVIGLEQFEVSHERGSHGGQSRLIRKAYFEHPNYVPLLEQAYHNWHELEQISEQQIYFPTSIAYMAPADHELLRGIRLSASKHQIAIQTRSELEPFCLPGGFEVIIEPDAGFLLPDVAIQQFSAQARQAGATILENTEVLSWHKTVHGDFHVITNKGEYIAEKLIFTSGAWTGRLLPMLEVPLKVTAQVLTWWQVESPWDFGLGNFPCWGFTGGGLDGLMYGFPVLPEKMGGLQGMKVAYHIPGESVSPEQKDGVSVEKAVNEIRCFLENHLPGRFRLLQASTCLYTYSPDEHFLIDFLDPEGKITVAAGFSGHGFKFSSVIGEILAEMVMNGKSTLPVDFLSAARFSRKGK